MAEQMELGLFLNLFFFSSFFLFLISSSTPSLLISALHHQTMAAAFLDKVNFSIDQPFGIKLDDFFSQGYQLVTGKSIDSFRFTEGVTPLSTNQEVIMWTLTYFVVIFGGRQIMKTQDAFKLKHAFILHNFLLTVASGALLLLFIENLVPILARHGLFYAICEAGAWTQRLELLYYLNYLVKYWELADTVFLVLKKKNLGTCTFFVWYSFLGQRRVFFFFG